MGTKYGEAKRFEPNVCMSLHLAGLRRFGAGGPKNIKMAFVYVYTGSRGVRTSIELDMLGIFGVCGEASGG